ncbi:hypothetical protein CVT24_005580 [Panaeolus cyanescens]|uniref:Uncharacterized protein n=1 Tax=Panaeolus cyanescens TaxID=181874 RepID=A0A409VQQ2_9AGAR|nr:hypothetical protein CVT24_005580 [Panaeolus cyanescens]
MDIIFRTLTYLRTFLPSSLGSIRLLESSTQRQRPALIGLLIDISGTLHVGKTPTPDAVRAFERLKESQVQNNGSGGGSGIPFRLCSNSSKESTESLVRRLEDMGFGVTEVEERINRNVNGSKRLVWTSIGAVAQKVQDMGLRKPYLLLSPSAAEEVKPGDDNANANKDADYDAVVVGLHPSSFNYETLNTAFRILKGEQNTITGTKKGPNSSTPAPIIATHKAKYIQTENGLSLGPGPFVTALENASGVDAIVMGKPTRSFFEMTIKDFGQELGGEHEKDGSRGRIAIIGDDVEADLGGGALELGLWRVLVRTGKYRSGDEVRPGVTPPDEIFDSFAAFIDSLVPLSNTGETSGVTTTAPDSGRHTS